MLCQRRRPDHRGGERDRNTWREAVVIYSTQFEIRLGACSAPEWTRDRVRNLFQFPDPRWPSGIPTAVHDKGGSYSFCRMYPYHSFMCMTHPASACIPSRHSIFLATAAVLRCDMFQIGIELARDSSSDGPKQTETKSVAATRSAVRFRL